MQLKIELKPIGEPQHELEEIRVDDVNGVSRRIGFCPTPNGSAVRFIRIPNDAEQRAAIVTEVTRLRSERGLTTDTRSSQPPNPDEIKSAMKKDKR